MIFRSGSTFLLSLMTVEEKIASFSEPFFDIMQEQFVKGPGNVEDKVNDLMECRFETIFSNLSDTRRGAKIQECDGAEARVMKTIRLRLWQMESWIKDSDIKVRRTFDSIQENIINMFEVIHLVRDPRGMISSILAKGWSAASLDSKPNCGRIGKDLGRV